jgi:predicted nuclease of predicted toxin-antitoxin system
MKLLFDQNLSPRLVNMLADLYPQSSHVSLVELDEVVDRDVWVFAQKYDFTIVSKDADFGDLSLLYGFPPKVIWIRRGNCSTKSIEQILRQNHPAIQSLQENPNSGILALL